MNKLVFLSGGMTGMKVSDCTLWRYEITEKITSLANGWHTFDPTVFGCSEYNTERFGADFERIAMNVDIANLRKSDVVICNMNKTDSIGTSMEIMLAKELNIPIIGFCSNENKEKLHPWWVNNVDIIAEDADEAVLLFIELYV